MDTPDAAAVRFRTADDHVTRAGSQEQVLLDNQDAGTAHVVSPGDFWAKIAVMSAIICVRSYGFGTNASTIPTCLGGAFPDVRMTGMWSGPLGADRGGLNI